MFEKDIRYRNRFSALRFAISHKIARCRNLDSNDLGADHDALELADGWLVMVAELFAGQTAIVAQLPVMSEPPFSEARSAQAQKKW